MVREGGGEGAMVYGSKWNVKIGRDLGPGRGRGEQRGKEVKGAMVQGSEGATGRWCICHGW